MEKCVGAPDLGIDDQYITDIGKSTHKLSMGKSTHKLSIRHFLNSKFSVDLVAQVNAAKRVT